MANLELGRQKRPVEADRVLNGESGGATIPDEWQSGLGEMAAAGAKPVRPRATTLGFRREKKEKRPEKKRFFKR